MKKPLALVLALLASVSVLAAESITQGKIIAPMAVPTSMDSKAQFTGLRPEALQLGLGDAVLIGSAQYQAQADGTERVTTRWHSIAAGSNLSVTQPLQAPLYSQFRTGDKSINPNTDITIKGDLDALADDFLKLKAKLGKDTPRDIERKTTNNNTTEAGRNANELAASGSGSSGSGNYSNSPYNLDSNNNKMNTDMVTTQWQDCQPRIDHAGGMVYAQARRLDVTESGKLMSTGSCEDHGNTAKITRTYDGDCQLVIDIDNRKVYHQFSEAADLDGKTVAVSACTADFTKSDPILTTTDTCGYRHDFTAGKSILQERLYYNDAEGKMVEVRGCGDSDKAFAQYTTTATCTPTIDTTNKQVFINQRVAFKDGNGAEQYASDCKPDGNPALAVSEAFCDPKYEHDFVNHVSYYRTRSYYVDKAGNTIYLTQCGRSAADSFPHTFETDKCQITNDDSKMMTHWNKVTEINTPSDGLLTIADCQEVGSPTPYAYVGPYTSQPVVIATNTLNSAASVAQRTPGVDWTNPRNTFQLTGGFSVNCDGCGIGHGRALGYFVGINAGYRIVSDTNTPFQCIWWQNVSNQYTGDCAGIYSYSDRTLLSTEYGRYMRGDGSYFDVETARHYNFQIANQNGGF